MDSLHIAKPLKWTGIAKLTGQALTLATTLVLVRVLDKESFGLFALVVLYTTVLDSVSDLGFQSAIIQCENVSPIKIASCFWVLSGVAVFVVLASQLLAPPLARIFSDSRLIELLRIGSFGILCLPLTVVSSGLMMRESRLEDVAKIEIVSSALRFVTAIALAIAGNGALSLVCAYLLEKVALSLLLRNASKWRPTCNFSYSAAKPLIMFGGHITIARLFWLAYSKIDTVIIGRYLGMEVLGIYSVASQIAMAFPQLISVTYYRVFFPIFSHTFRLNEKRLASAFLQSNELLSTVTLPITIGLVVVASDVVVTMLGDNWRPALPAVQVLSIVAAQLTLSGLLPQGMNAVGRADVGAWINLVTLIVFAPAFYFGAITNGLDGVLTAWLILMPLRLIANAVAASRLIGFSALEYLDTLVSSSIAACLMAAVVYALAIQMSACTTILRLMSCIICGVLVYGGVYFVCYRNRLIRALLLLRNGPIEAG